MGPVRNAYTNIDWLTILVWIGLVTFGLMNIYSANIMNGDGSFFDFSQRSGKQLIWIGASILFIIVIFLLDAKFFPFFAYLLYGLTLFTLIAVLIVGKEINGAKSWFVIGGFQFQPSEFAKPFTALALARLMSTHGFVIRKARSIVLCGLLVLSPAMLIMLQPDMGSSLVYFAFLLVLYREGFSQNTMILGFSLIVLFIMTLLLENTIVITVIWSISILILKFAGTPNKILLTIFATGTGIFGILTLLNYLLNTGLSIFHNILLSIASVIMISLFIAYKLRNPNFYKILAGMSIAVVFIISVDYAMNKMLKEYHRQRINITLGLEDDPQGIGYNVNQSKIAIGSGGFSGKGFLNGTQTKLQFVPEQSTDFIFCTVGEEWGFIGTAAVVILFVFLIIRLVLLAERQRSKFSRLYGYGLVSVLLMHFTVNIGMTIGLFPVIGIPLPFFSYGGSSMLAFTIFLFIFIKLDSNRKSLLR